MSKNQTENKTKVINVTYSSFTLYTHGKNSIICFTSTRVLNLILYLVMPLESTVRYGNRVVWDEEGIPPTVKHLSRW